MIYITFLHEAPNQLTIKMEDLRFSDQPYKQSNLSRFIQNPENFRACQAVHCEQLRVHRYRICTFVLKKYEKAGNPALREGSAGRTGVPLRCHRHQLHLLVRVVDEYELLCFFLSRNIAKAMHGWVSR